MDKGKGLKRTCNGCKARALRAGKIGCNLGYVTDVYNMEMTPKEPCEKPKSWRKYLDCLREKTAEQQTA